MIFYGDISIAEFMPYQLDGEKGVLDRSRTGDLPLRRRLLYPLSYGDLLDAEGYLVTN